MNACPLTLCLTNTVAANFTANVLLAIGAKPALIEEASEAAELAAVADAVLVNVGTLTPTQADVMRAAVQVCQQHGTPWVLDPVACHLLSYRRTVVRAFIARKPSIIRGNHAEIDFLLGTDPNLKGTVPILSTGAEDRIYLPQTGTDPLGLTGTDPLGLGSVPIVGGGSVPIGGGVPMLQTVTATGCAQGAVCAALLGRGLSPVEACLAASRLMKRAGERAYARAKTPGAFQTALLDELYESH